jgi:thiol-disulfide isomerase/thioredoxin
MRLVWRFLAVGVLSAFPNVLSAQQAGDPVQQALAQGDLYSSKRKYELALDAYHKADKAAHHGSALCYLKLASVERKLGDFSTALDDTKKAVKVAGDDKAVALQAHLQRAALLVQMSGKPSDKKLREAEEELRQALMLDAGKPLSHFNLGVVLLKQERDTEGLAELNTCVGMPGVDRELEAEARRMIAAPIRARAPFAPDFSFTTHQNQDISNGALRGKVVLLDFWGTWCPPCRESVPILRNLNKKYAGKAFQLVGVSSDDDEDVWRTFTEAQHMDWQEYIDLSGKVLEAFKIESFPTYVVLDKDGVIRFRQSGLGQDTQGELEDAINKALKKESDPALAAAAPAAPATAKVNASADRSAGGEGKPAGSGTEKMELLSGIEVASISGGIYKNEVLGMTYELPKNWVAAKAEATHALNERTSAAAKASVLQQHPEMVDSLRLMIPTVVLYASRKGEGDGQHMSVPCLRIVAMPSRLDALRMDAFRQMTESMARAQNMKMIAEGNKYEVNGHEFARADFERGAGERKAFEAYVQTLAGDYMLTIEIYAASTEELQRTAESLKSMMIKDEEE